MDNPVTRALETDAFGTRSEARQKGPHDTGALLDNAPMLAARGSENAAIAGESDALLLNADTYSYLTSSQQPSGPFLCRRLGPILLRR